MNESRTSQARNDDRTLAVIVAEFLDELQRFVQTRVEMVRSELRETIAAAGVWLSLGAVALVLLMTSYLLLTLALVALVSFAFAASAYRWFFSFLTVGLLWSAAGIALAYLAWIRFRARAMFPKKTVEVLKADKIWLQRETRSQM
jgi:uncharacterized membrane protein YqjE